jgi:hypothetical protein
MGIPTTVAVAPAPVRRSKHNFDSGTALTAILAVLDFRETPLPDVTTPEARGPIRPQKENR